MKRKFRWTRSENLHITVRFLGQVELAAAEAIAGRVEAASPRGFTLQLGKLDAFKRGKLARVLWVGLAMGQAEVTALTSLVEAECVRAGLRAEERTYHPHLTLARSRELRGDQMPLIHVPELPPWRAEDLILYRSHLGGHSGPVYEPLRTIKLG